MIVTRESFLTVEAGLPILHHIVLHFIHEPTASRSVVHHWGAGHLGGNLLYSNPTIFEALGLVRLIVELLVLMENGGRGLPSPLASVKVLLAPSREGGRRKKAER